MSGKNKASRNIVIEEKPVPETSENNVSTLPLETVSKDGFEAPESPKGKEQETEETEGFSVPAKKVSGFGVRSVGFLGFGSGSGSEALALGLSDPKGKTREELDGIYRAVKPGSDTRSSVPVFLSDVSRIFLTDSGSSVGRSIRVEKGEKSGKYRFNPSDLSRAIEAIGKGILPALRTVPAKGRTIKNPEYTAILARFGFVPESPKEEEQK
jgi:hypothetical protein